MRPSKELLKIVSCPISGGKLEYNQKHNVVYNLKEDVFYPVMDGIPILLEAEANKISESDIDLEEKLEEA